MNWYQNVFSIWEIDESTDPDQQVFFMVYRKRACAILKFDSFYLSNLPGKTDRIVK